MGHTEKIACLAATWMLLLAPAVAAAQGADRVERRSEQMALPDAYLDPAWPDAGARPRVAPEESDSVEEVPLEEEKPDAAEAEEAERYTQELAAPSAVPTDDEMQRDEMGGTPEQPEPDDEEARDPAQW